MSRATDLYFEIEQELKRILPAQSFLPNQIYRAMNKAQIWLSSVHDCYTTTEKITILSDITEYELVETFKRIQSLISPDNIPYDFVKPHELYVARKNAITTAFTIENDTLIFATNQNNYAGSDFTITGFAIATTEPSDTQELLLPVQFDEAIFYYSLYRLLPLVTPNRSSFFIEAEKSALHYAGKNNSKINEPTGFLTTDW